MNSQIFLVIFCLFHIFWGLSDAEAKPTSKTLSLFNYDDEVDVFQTRNQQELSKENAAKKGGYQAKHKSHSSGNHHEASDMFAYADYDEASELESNFSKDQELDNNPSKDRELDNNPSKERKLDDNPSKERELDNRPSKERELDNNPSKERELDNKPSKERELDNSSSKEREPDNNPSKERKLDYNSSKERKLDNNPSKERELDNKVSEEQDLLSFSKPLKKHPLEDSNSDFKMNNDDDTNISIKKWNWMEWILRQQPKSQIQGRSK